MEHRDLTEKKKPRENPGLLSPGWHSKRTATVSRLVCVSLLPAKEVFCHRWISIPSGY